MSAAPADLNAILSERGKSHGEFRDHARCAQGLKAVVRDELVARAERDQPELEAMALEAIDMVLHKIARAVAGEWAFADHWDDIAGYAKLVADRVRGPAKPETVDLKVNTPELAPTGRVFSPEELAARAMAARAEVLADALARERDEGPTKLAQIIPENIPEPAKASPGNGHAPPVLASPAPKRASPPTRITPEQDAVGRALAHPEPEKPKPVVTTLPTGRDPLLAREIGLPPSGKSLPADQHKGSQGQQLADRIVRDLPTLMRMHLRGPTRNDLAGFYRATQARVDEAVRSLFAKKAIRLERPNGGEQHIVPGDWPDTIAPAAIDQAPAANGYDRSGRKQAVLDALKARAVDGLVTMSMNDIAANAGVAQGSVPYLLGELIDKDGLLAIAAKAPVGTRTPATYRIVQP